MANYGRETIQLVEIDQPRCTRVYGDGVGSSPSSGCQAVLGTTGERKCYNTRATCQDQENFSDGTLTLRFSRAQEGVLQYGPLIPSLLQVATTPMSINLSGMDRSESALGRREVATLNFQDHRHSDLLVDKYRLERHTGDATILHSGFAAGGSPAADNASSLELDSDAADGEFDGMLLRLVTGPGSVQERTISSYAGGVATVETPWATNALTRSSEIDHADWTKQNGITITANYALAPDGAFKADRVQATDGSLQRYFQTISGFSGKTVCFALKMRSLTGVDQQITMHIRETGFGTTYVTQNKTVTPEWDTHFVTVAIPGGSVAVMALMYEAGGSGDWDIAVCDHQFHEGTEPREFIETGASPITLPDSSTAYEVVADQYDPYARGTFWGKWLARNPFYSGYPVRVYDGYLGDAVGDMRVRHYVVDSITGPVEGAVKIVAKDRFSLIDRRKALAPRASRGELAAAITESSPTATITPADIVEEDYPFGGSPAEMIVAIGDELMRCSRSGATITFIERGAFGTEAAEHGDDEPVQWVLQYSADRVHEVIYDLLVTYGGLDPALIDLTEWAERAANISDLFTTKVAKPTPVDQLIGELMVQAGCTVWPDVSTNEIRFAALRAGSISPVVTDQKYIVDGTFSSKRDAGKRVSQVHVYYGQVNPLEDLKETRNYRSRLITPLDHFYETEAIETVFSRWIPTSGRQSAARCSDRILAMQGTEPLEAAFSVHASRDGDFEFARYFYLQTADVQDETGAEDQVTMACISLERGENQYGIAAVQIAFADEVGSDGLRVIPIENNLYNVNLRDLHDSLFAAPEVSSPSLAVSFQVLTGVTVGSTSTSLAAMRTGTWPEGVNVFIENAGRIQGKGGAGGTGGGFSNASAGQAGGTALLVEHPTTIDNTDGEIWGGGGGGGGGGQVVVDILGIQFTFSGGGAGGGAGTDPGAGAASGISHASGSSGSNGSATAGGSGGAGASNDPPTFSGGAGGTGGGPGLAGSTGASASGGNVANHAGAAGGPAGKYIEGISLVTWVPGGSPTATGDVRGGVS